MSSNNVTPSSNTPETEIKFRSKFAKKVPLELFDKFVQTVHSVNAMPDELALSTLWQMTYVPERTLQTFGFTSIDPAEVPPEDGFDYISEELCTSFRNELRFQRTLVSENFPEATVSEVCKEAFDNLKNATKQDSITSVIVLNACSNLVNFYDSYSVERCLALLNSYQEKNIFGGIRSLHFNYEEAVFLKPYSTQIASLLSAMWEEKKLRTEGYKPLENLDQMLQEKREQCEEKNEEVLSVEVPSSNEVRVQNASIPVEAENVSFEETSHLDVASIIANINVVENFVTVCNNLKEAGLNPVEVASKLDAISKILDGIKELR